MTFQHLVVANDLPVPGGMTPPPLVCRVAVALQRGGLLPAGVHITTFYAILHLGSLPLRGPLGCLSCLPGCSTDRVVAAPPPQCFFIVWVSRHFLNETQTLVAMMSQRGGEIMPAHPPSGRVHKGQGRPSRTTLRSEGRPTAGLGLERGRMIKRRNPHFLLMFLAGLAMVHGCPKPLLSTHADLVSLRNFAFPPPIFLLDGLELGQQSFFLKKSLLKDRPALRR